MTVLALALVGALSGSHLLGAGVRGRASADVVPLPPPVGSCVAIAPDAGATVVDCDEPHAGEVAMTWRAGVQPVTVGTPARHPQFSVVRSISDPASDSRCTGWAVRYTGWDRYVARHDDEFWLAPQPLVVGRLIRAPLDGAIPQLAWTGCATITADATYVGSIRDAAFSPREQATGVRPAGVSVCLSASDAGLRFLSCAVPHNAELLGSISLSAQMMVQRSVTLQQPAAEIARGCAALAAGRIGRADPTFGGRLEIATESLWQRSLREQKPTTSAWLIPDCLIRVAGDGYLIGSVVEWGERPLDLWR